MTEVDWVVGRAGMLYRDLIADRAGGRLLGSQIRIPRDGDAGDWVHFHRVAVQVIFVLQGRVQLVYEDQGPPFWAEAGDCVLQPPTIRHRVLQTAGGLEVLELVSPAEHQTEADARMELPTGRVDPERRFEGQRFVWDRAEDATWRGSGPVERRVTALGEASGGAAELELIRAVDSGVVELDGWAGLRWLYCWSGSAELDGVRLAEAEGAFVGPQAELRVRPGAVVVDWRQGV